MLDLKKKVLIMGAGVRGKRVLHYFRNCGTKVYGFLDNDDSKWNTVVEGVTCYPVEQFKDHAEEYVVYYTIENHEECLVSLEKIYPNIVGEDIVTKIGYLPESIGYEKFFPLGHFYNQYPVMDEIEKKKDRLYDLDKEILGINFNEKIQLDILEKMFRLYDKLPKWKRINDEEESVYRYRYGNPSLSSADTIGLSSMLQIIRPRRVIEVGSGWSSAVMLDTNEYLMNNSMELSFIEPYPDLLKSILKETDNIDLQQEGLENIDVRYFQKLEAGDILFIDSTHVSKMGSDVNYLFFDIIPRLKKGVYVHLHDIFYPFEYPMEWIRKGMVWSELYLLRSFLQYNDTYEMVFFQNMMEKKYLEKFQENWPVDSGADEESGGSFWMRKVK